MSKPFIALLAALAAISMIAAGCGGGDSTDSSSLTKAEFVKQGNALCAKGNKEINQGFEEFAKENGFSEKQKPTKAQMTEVIETVVIPGIRGQVEGIEGLEPPSGEEAKVEAITDAANEALEKGEEDPAVLTSQKAGPFAKADKLASAYGLVKCGEE
ncbi:MAG TPA: hypothetical protein VFK14_10665 [Solirubrobacterales bacterium]|nr:hypothetical protein [Solirubrobacterales bacterium]